MNFKGKSVLITGGTGALGRVVALRFSKAGAAVVSSCTDEKERKLFDESIRDSILLLPCDVTQEEQVASLFERALSGVAKIDILVNIVGGFVPGAPVKDVELKDWDLMMNLNLRSAFLCAREFLRRAAGAPYGRIISMAAMPALRPEAGKSAYAASKSGIIVLTEILGLELKGSGITANAIAPSIIDTEANRASMPDADPALWVSPEEIAELMLFLCSEQGSSINGACIPAFGGV